jgi:hypothetical protein
MTPSLHRRAQHSTRTLGGRPNPFNHRRSRPRGWSIYGAQRAQLVATGGKWNTPENRSNKPIRNRWQPTATVSERMVRRGSTVRVRQRALQKRRTSAPLRSERLALDPACGGYGVVYGAFALRTRLGRELSQSSPRPPNAPSRVAASSRRRISRTHAATSGGATPRRRRAALRTTSAMQLFVDERTQQTAGRHCSRKCRRRSSASRTTSMSACVL